MKPRKPYVLWVVLCELTGLNRGIPMFLHRTSSKAGAEAWRSKHGYDHAKVVKFVEAPSRKAKARKAGRRK